jgi:integrase
MTFTELFQTEADKRTGSTYQTWTAALKHWTNYVQTKIGQGFEDQAKGLRLYLLDQCSQNSAATYWAKFKAVCQRGFEDGILQTFKLPSISHLEAHRSHLNASEVQLLVRVHCHAPEVKKMALFSILTGMRWSDIAKLRYQDMQQTQSGWAVLYIQEKTDGVEYLPISDQAAELLNPTGQKSGRIFSTKYTSRVSGVLKMWCEKAGITTHITFHSFRHTHAVLQLEAGTDIYTLSKLLGHRDIKTTQIYAKISDKAKRAAVNRVVI